MCGRFASARKRQELLEEFGVQRDRVAEPLRPDYNVAPTKPVYAVVTRRLEDAAKEHGAGPDAAGPDTAGPDAARPDTDGPDTAGQHGAEDTGAKDEGAAGPEGVRELRVVRWGLVPFWAKDISIGSRLINARAETVASKPAFRRAFARHRCLLPADGFYEWEKSGDPKHPRKQPYYIHREDGGVLAFAGLYELWRDKDRPDEDPGAWLWTATIITTRAEDEVGRIHDRMPMVIEPDRWADWLDPAATSAEALHGLLTPAASAHLTSHPVSTEVNSVRNNGPGLIEPMEGDSEPAGSPRDGAGGRNGASRGAPSTLF
ncbi:MAG TPA: SOS response-associated peptidase [Streptosporangiaceae bacterium]|nr:SOS response-associated peptidase [Streptosporangiaceae bacterium]